MSSTSDGTANESLTVLPVPESCSELRSAVAFGSFDILPSARRPWTTWRRLSADASSRVSARRVPVTPPSMWVMTAKVLTAGSLLAISAGIFAWFAMASKRPTAQALLPWSMSETSSIISLLLVMLWAVSCASMAPLIAVSLPIADQAGLEEREHHDVGRLADGGPVGGRAVEFVVIGQLDEALALVFLDDAAVLAGEGLELGGVEAAARDDQAVGVARAGDRRAGHRGDDVVDVVLDVDAGFLLEFFLALFLREDLLEALAELRVHHFADVGEGDDRGISRDVTQLRRS